ncbi:MAG TPA: ATP-binding protein [Ignavibacteriaceae bacterium]|nr:ATP-binding protein [Ignavibacteriaceae bacterium]
MSQPVTIEDLRKVAALQNLPDEHLQWILDRSEYIEYNDGDTLLTTGEPIDHMYCFFEGKMNFYMNVSGKLVYYHSIENNAHSGGITGVLPYSRLKTSPGSAYATGRLRGIKIHKKYFKELEQLNPDFIQHLIGYMTERARSFATTQIQQEKVSALGKLAAGIAHEMNNPAAAISRISEELNKRLKRNFRLTKELLKYNISPELLSNIQEMAGNKENNSSRKTKFTPLQCIQNENELNEWLNEKGINSSNEMAETFSEAGITQDELEKIIQNVPGEAFQNILDWLENLMSSELIIKDLDNASDRITMLVGAIKSHVRMDRSGDLHKTNIHEDIENTLLLLGYKINEKNISLEKKFCDDMNGVDAYVGELNQVWTNIIDNAIYAVSQNGEIVIETKCDKKHITVRITDNGTGIPKEIQSRIFDPFFTTKKVGEGTGIGLDISRNVINRHKGEIKVYSVPGQTEFIISIPISQ